MELRKQEFPVFTNPRGFSHTFPEASASLRLLCHPSPPTAPSPPPPDAADAPPEAADGADFFIPEPWAEVGGTACLPETGMGFRGWGTPEASPRDPPVDVCALEIWSGAFRCTRAAQDFGAGLGAGVAGEGGGGAGSMSVASPGGGSDGSSPGVERIGAEASGSLGASDLEGSAAAVDALSRLGEDVDVTEREGSNTDGGEGKGGAAPSKAPETSLEVAALTSCKIGEWLEWLGASPAEEAADSVRLPLAPLLGSGFTNDDEASGA